MNTLRIYPKEFREHYIKQMKNAGIEIPPDKYNNKTIIITLVITIILSSIFYFLNISMIISWALFIFMNIFIYFRISLKASARIKSMEKVFPDVISLMASNLRSGVTVDRSFLLSARPEFKPLDEEILKTGKEVATGKDIIYALQKMSERIDSEKISKVVMLIISGLKAGGNISDLLEQTSRNMKEKEIIEKKATSSILMYVIFIFFAVGVGTPLLFGLSTVLVEIVMSLTSKIPEIGASQINLPLTFSKVSISLNFVVYFSMIFIVITDLISSVVIGLVNKGEGKAGLRYFLPLVLISLSVFFIVRAILSKLLVEVIANV